MGVVGLLLISGMLAISVAYSSWGVRSGLRCPACAHQGADVVEDERAHLGWVDETDHWLPVYEARRHFHCGNCGHGWWQMM